MPNKLELYKKKLLYRASYRGTKEMDILLSKFVKKYLDKMNQRELKDLENFLEFEDEVILNFFDFNKIDENIDKNSIAKILKILRFNGGEGGIRTHERVAPVAGFQDQCFQPLSHLSLYMNTLFFTTKVNK